VDSNDDHPLSRLELLALAHALRTPLTTLSMGLELLRHERADSANARRDVVAALVDASEELRRLVDRSLHIERLGAYVGPPAREVFDVRRIVGEAIEPLRVQAKKRRVRFSSRAAARRVMVRGDALKLAWIATALVGNALRYARPGGFVEVVVTARREEARMIVRDDGPGIPSSVVAELESPHTASVLTLHLVREIAEAHGGRLVVAPSTLGAVVEIVVPRARVRRSDDAA